MTVFNTIFIVILIVLVFLTQRVNLRVRHTEGYIIDVDTPFLGFTLDTAKNERERKRSEGAKKRGGKNPTRAYYYAASYLVSHSMVAVGKLFPPRDGEDTPLTLLPTYTVLYSALSLVVNKSERTTLAADFSHPTDSTPNIDAAFSFSLIYLIISLLLLQYYKRKERKEII